ncbi:PPE family protein [Mycobacterium rhizamassiliense]|uniref:PPE family protein n=1 Tax=Mycobacterium rhizamassiliense TaxID=1841860 RepID=A0A2U3NPA1_9MYCO|nr:PPE family protein [Mycobacterium rhizamassiliense]SPM33294.1 PPE family protein [Mycobacterium rhizamassiliense]
MTAPIWMAAPPEVHSALLSSGPGPASLLASAGEWNTLSAEYASVAEELSALLAEVQAGAWEGPSAESYVAAHVPYLAWLTKASADSAAMAAEQETAAAAYTAALAAMPTLPELAANHVVHGTLLATNFFGINTIPIAVNEADYARMWVQAATTMSTYQAVSSAAVASTPQADAAPMIVKADDEATPPNQPPTDISGDNPLGLPQWLRDILNQLGIGNNLLAHDPTVNNIFDQLLANFLHNFGINWNPAAGTVNGFTYDQYTNPATLIFWVVRGLEKFEDFQQFFVYLGQNPLVAFQYLGSLILFDWPLHIIEELPYLPALLSPEIAAVAAPAGAVGGLAGLAGLAAAPPSPMVAPVAPPAALPGLLPALGSTPIAAPAAAPTSAPAPSPAPTTSTVAGPPPPSGAPPPAAGPGFAPPYLVGPGLGLGSGMGSSASSSAKRKAPEPDSAAAAAVTAAGEAARMRRRQRARQRGHGDEYMDMNVDVAPDWGGGPSDRGAGTLGFAGAVRGETAARAAGLTTLESDEFGGGPRMPMLPGSWKPDGDSEDVASQHLQDGG